MLFIADLPVGVLDVCVISEIFTHISPICYSTQVMPLRAGLVCHTRGPMKKQRRWGTLEMDGINLKVVKCMDPSISHALHS